MVIFVLQKNVIPLQNSVQYTIEFEQTKLKF
jgi:hypothetical protein